jgi:hypothetical protein
MCQLNRLAGSGASGNWYPVTWMIRRFGPPASFSSIYRRVAPQRSAVIFGLASAKPSKPSPHLRADVARPG